MPRRPKNGYGLDKFNRLAVEKATIRKQRFAHYYVTNGFNASKAYQAAYEKPRLTTSVMSCGSRLLNDVLVIKSICRELEILDLDVNDKYLLAQALQIVNKSDTRDADKIKAMDFISSIKGFKRNDNNVMQVAIFADIDEKIKSIVEKRIESGQFQGIKAQVGTVNDSESRV